MRGVIMERGRGRREKRGREGGILSIGEDETGRGRKGEREREREREREEGEREREMEREGRLN
jgi:hypothetical protein